MSRPPDIPVSATLPQGDGDDFCRLAEMLVRAGERSGLTVNIINAHQVNVYDQSKGAEVMSKRTNIRAEGSVVNYKSRLENVQLRLNASASEGVSDGESRVHQAIAALATQLHQVRGQHSEALVVLAGRLDELALLVTKPKEERNPGLIKLSAKGLKEAAKTVGDIVPGLLKSATAIARMIAGLNP